MEYSFVLGGGGAKSFPQLGAMDKLLKEGITPTYLSGTSMGAVNAVLFAAGMTIDELYEFYATHKALDFMTLGFSTNGILVNDRLGNLVADYCKSKGYENLEDLPIKTCVAVTDSKTGQAVFLNKGNIKQIIMATTATFLTKHTNITDEAIKKQVCEQTGREYVEGMKIKLKDGCYSANVPFDGLDYIRDPENKANYCDLCFDVVPTYKATPLIPLNIFNKKVYNNDRERINKFIQNYNGVYMEFECGLEQVNFNKKYLDKGFNYGVEELDNKYLKQIHEYIELVESDAVINIDEYAPVSLEEKEITNYTNIQNMDSLIYNTEQIEEQELLN